jgi:hypothetical protein
MNPREIALRGLVLMFLRYKPHPAKALGRGGSPRDSVWWVV